MQGGGDTPSHRCQDLVGALPCPFIVSLVTLPLPSWVQTWGGDACSKHIDGWTMTGGYLAWMMTCKHLVGSQSIPFQTMFLIWGIYVLIHSHLMDQDCGKTFGLFFFFFLHRHWRKVWLMSVVFSYSMHCNSQVKFLLLVLVDVNRVF